MLSLTSRDCRSESETSEDGRLTTDEMEEDFNPPLALCRLPHLGVVLEVLQLVPSEGARGGICTEVVQ